MSVQAQSADGVIHDFPDGTDPAVVDRAMKAYAAPKTGPKVTPKPSLAENVTGLMANLNRGLGIGDEIHAGMVTLGDAADGNVHGFSDIPRAFKANMARERQTEDRYTAANPFAAGLARGTGMAATMAVPTTGAANLFADGSRAVNAARGATVAGLQAAGYAAIDRGSPMERLSAAGAAARDPLVLGMGAAGGALATAPKAKPLVPTKAQLTADKNDAYAAVRASGEKYSPQAFDGMLKDMATKMDAEGFSAGSHPKAFAKIQALQQTQQATGGYSPSLEDLDQLRQQIGRDVASSADKGDRRMGTIMRNQIDQFIDDQGGSPDLLRARDLNTRVEKLSLLDKLDAKAARRAASTGSGGNINNTQRQNMDKFIDKTPNLTPEETDAAMKVVMGTPSANIFRQAGKLSPEGNGLGLTTAVGAGAVTHGGSALISGPGFIAKRVADHITNRNVNALRDLIASGGEAAQEVSRQFAADPTTAGLRREVAARLSRAAGVAGAGARASRNLFAQPEPATSSR